MIKEHHLGLSAAVADGFLSKTSKIEAVKVLDLTSNREVLHAKTCPAVTTSVVKVKKLKLNILDLLKDDYAYHEDCFEGLLIEDSETEEQESLRLILSLFDRLSKLTPLPQPARVNSLDQLLEIARDVNDLYYTREEIEEDDPAPFLRWFKEWRNLPLDLPSLRVYFRQCLNVLAAKDSQIIFRQILAELIATPGSPLRPKHFWLREELMSLDGYEPNCFTVKALESTYAPSGLDINSDALFDVMSDKKAVYVVCNMPDDEWPTPVTLYREAVLALIQAHTIGNYDGGLVYGPQILGLLAGVFDINYPEGDIATVEQQIDQVTLDTIKCLANSSLTLAEACKSALKL